MTKTLCPAGCGKKYITSEHAERHADADHPGWREPKQQKSRGWATPHGFVDFSTPVTYEHACEVARAVQEQVFRDG